MIGYVTLGTNDLSKGAPFYDALAAEMGTERIAGSEEAGFIAWGPPDGVGGISIIKPYNGDAATVGNGVMVAFHAKSREEVDRLYKKALSLGGADEGAPGMREGEPYYVCYFRDLDGNKLNAFTMAE
ncbi:VOC family protein [Actibacterium sp. 188UL27-1]|uniref:VOC family protein n=1 Tax=Actibacterium sp. 188UL27-1 TaxID=2786961 RepID=UPI001959BA41|nr:VOC family protein [Actibacterium sp. 188UL27-1]MBM7070380.1 VOC family protein [Actibacterium sp. 188UL27-1]